LFSRWYVLQNKYQKEDRLYRLLVDKGYEVYYPRLRVNPVNPRAKKERPYFPGYMFVQSDLSKDHLRVFQRMPYAIGLVSFGGVPAVVPDHVIDTLKKNLDSEMIRKPSGKKFVSGDRIKILKGPFSGYEGIFDKSLAGESRVQVLLSLLNDRKIMIELSARDVEKSYAQRNLGKGEYL